METIHSFICSTNLYNTYHIPGILFVPRYLQVNQVEIVIVLMNFFLKQGTLFIHIRVGEIIPTFSPNKQLSVFLLYVSTDNYILEAVTWHLCTK